MYAFAAGRLHKRQLTRRVISAVSPPVIVCDSAPQLRHCAAVSILTSSFNPPAAKSVADLWPLRCQRRMFCRRTVPGLSHSLAQDVLNVLMASDPENNGLPLAAIAAELPDVVLEEIQERYGGLKTLMEKTPHLLTLQQVPPNGRYVGKRAPLNTKPPVSPATPQPLCGESQTKKRKKVQHPDCWNTALPPRDLIQEHAALLGTLSEIEDASPCCLTFPKHLTVLNRFLAVSLVECNSTFDASHSSNAIDSDDDVVANALAEVILPNKDKLYAVAISRSIFTAAGEPGDDCRLRYVAREQGATLKRAIIHDALNDPEVLSTPTQFLLLISSHPAQQLRHGDAFEQKYAASHLGKLLLENRAEPQEYDAYRLARLVGVNAPTPLHDLLKPAAEVLTITAAKEHEQFGVQLSLLSVALAFPQLFELLPASDYNQSGGDLLAGPVAMRFRLDSRYLPPADELMKYNDEELIAKIAEAREAGKTRPSKKVNNRVRVAAIEELRHLTRLQALRASRISACDPNVLAYWLFDAMEVLQEAPPTGMVAQLLPAEVQARTNGRSKAFLNQYPHLFKIVPAPPEYLLYRSDWAIPSVSTVADFAAMSDVDFLTIIIGAYLEAKKVRRSKDVYVSSVAMRLPSGAIHRLRKEGGLSHYMTNHPECFNVNLPCVELVEEGSMAGI